LPQLGFPIKANFFVIVSAVLLVPLVALPFYQ
jgi:hypothetical protein